MQAMICHLKVEFGLIKPSQLAQPDMKSQMPSNSSFFKLASRIDSYYNERVRDFNFSIFVIYYIVVEIINFTSNMYENMNFIISKLKKHQTLI